jgi:hypothetical protein
MVVTASRIGRLIACPVGSKSVWPRASVSTLMVYGEGPDSLVKRFFAHKATFWR